MKKKKQGVLIASALALLLIGLGTGLLRGRKAVSPEEIVFSVEAQGAAAQISLWHNYYDNKEYLFLPAFCDETTTARIEDAGWREKSWDGQTLRWRDTIGSGEHPLTDGEHRLQAGGAEYTVVVMRSANVPALFLTTASGSLGYIEAVKGNNEAGLYRMVNADGSLRGDGQVAKMKARGNSTFLEDKKPYQITLTERADLLETGLLNKYILLANRQDQSMLRDRIVYDMAGDMGLAYSPVSIFVDLYINNAYRGTYQLSEKVDTLESGGGRVAIHMERGKAETDFLVSLEYNDEERLEEAPYRFVTETGQNVLIDRPGEPDEEQEVYLAGAFRDAERAIRAGSIADAGIDITSFARKYLVEEISKNLDAMYTSQYFYECDGTLYAGPVWDYDKSLGNPVIEHNRPVNFQEPRGIFAATKQKNASWWYDLYQIPAFRACVEREYEQAAVPAIQAMLDGGIDRYREEIWASAAMDYIRWDTFEDFKHGEPLEFAASYEAEIDIIRDFLEDRMLFCSDIWLEGRRYDRILCDPGPGTMYVTQIDAVEGRKLREPRDPKREGWRFDHWIRKDTGEVYDFSQVYDGVPFTLQAVYVEE